MGNTVTKKYERKVQAEIAKYWEDLPSPEEAFLMHRNPRHFEPFSGELNGLPLIDSVVEIILGFVPKEDLYSVALTCKQFYSILEKKNKIKEDITISDSKVLDRMFQRDAFRHPRFSKLQRLRLKLVDHITQPPNFTGVESSLRTFELTQKSQPPLYNGLVTNKIIAAVTKLTSLEKLVLAGCQFIDTAPILNLIQTLTSLTYLVLHNTKKMKADSVVAAAMKKKRQWTGFGLTCSPNLSDTSIDLITKTCTSLKVLLLQQSSNLTPTSLKHILERCSVLQELGIRGCKFFGSTIANVTPAFANSLERLSVDSIETSAALLMHCTALTHLETKGSEANKKIIGQLTNLKCLQLIFFNNSNGDFLKNFVNMEHINVSLSAADNSWIQTLCPVAPKLKNLDLYGCKQITDEGITAVALCKNLEKITLDTLKITDASLASLSMCWKLKHLSLGDCNITDKGLHHLASGCHRLVYLNLQRCTGVTDVGVTAIAKNCPDLNFVCLYGCRKLTDAAVIVVAENCKNITGLQIDECSELTDKSLESIAKNLKNLKFISMKAVNYTTNGVVSLRRGCRQLERVTLSSNNPNLSYEFLWHWAKIDNVWINEE